MTYHDGRSDLDDLLGGPLTALDEQARSASPSPDPLTSSDESARRAEGSLATGVVLAVAGVGVLGAQWLRWVTAQVGGDPLAFRGIDLDLARFLFVLLGLALLSCGIETLIRRREEVSPVGAGIALSVVVLSGLLILAIEIVSGLVPKDLVPVTIRRLTVRIAAGVGLWATLALGLVGLLAAWGGVRLAVDRWRALQGGAGLWSAALGVVLLVVGAVVLGVGRYEEVFVASAASHTVVVEGWSTPWFGPITVTALWVVVLCIPLLLVRTSLTASAVVVFAAWVASLLAAVVLILGGGVEWAEPLLVERIPDEAASVDPDVSLGRGPWLIFCGALLAGVGALLTAAHASTRAGLDTGRDTPSQARWGTARVARLREGLARRASAG